jgi:hypothetical protein
VPSYLVEAYCSRSETPARATGGAFRRSLFVPEDELCLHLLDAASIEAAKEIVDRAQVKYARIVEAIELAPHARRGRGWDGMNGAMLRTHRDGPDAGGGSPDEGMITRPHETMRPEG